MGRVDNPRTKGHITVPMELCRTSSGLGCVIQGCVFFRSQRVTLTAVIPLVDVMQDWLGGARPVSVLDFSGVPALAADLAIGVVLSLILETSLRCTFDGPGIGRPSPVLIVLEEAHRYLGDRANPLTREAANRIAREGRKYGVGLLLVSQRPTELPATALAQCGTVISPSPLKFRGPRCNSGGPTGCDRRFGRCAAVTTYRGGA